MAATGAASWSFGGRSVMGASHVRYGIPNQDAIAWSPRTGSAASAVLTLADGHGAAPHFRSGIGAHMAVEAATAVLSEALAEAGWIAAKNVVHADIVAHEIIARWRAAVRDHVAKNPLDAAAGDPYLPYGATLIAAAVAPEGLFVLQLGDGDLLLGKGDGSIVRPLLDDEGMIGQQTYSLCLPEAETLVRSQMLPARDADIDFVMLSTDGLAKSFQSEQAFRRHAAAWRTLIGLIGLPEVLDRLDRWLSVASRQGSGDDITLGFIARDLPAERPRIAAWLKSGLARARPPAFGDLHPAVRLRRALLAAGAMLLGLIGLALVGTGGYFLARWLF